MYVRLAFDWPLYYYLHFKSPRWEICKTVSLAVTLYAAHAWFPTLREEQRVRLFEDKVLRRIFKPKREGVIGCRKLHEEELHNLYSSLHVFMVWCLIKYKDNYAFCFIIFGKCDRDQCEFHSRRHWVLESSDANRNESRALTHSKS